MKRVVFLSVIGFIGLAVMVAGISADFDLLAIAGSLVAVVCGSLLMFPPKLSLCLALAALLLLTACSTKPQSQWSAQGTVRNVWCHPEVMVATCDVVFEHDSGPLQTLTFYGADVPLWVGLHAKLNYHSTDTPISGLDWVQRVP